MKYECDQWIICEIWMRSMILIKRNRVVLVFKLLWLDDSDLNWAFLRNCNFFRIVSIHEDSPSDDYKGLNCMHIQRLCNLLLTNSGFVILFYYIERRRQIQVLNFKLNFNSLFFVTYWLERWRAKLEGHPPLCHTWSYVPSLPSLLTLFLVQEWNNGIVYGK